ncbi:hypothetical protein Rs2_16317 [Raphanus sativus]|nr:hypothetical protein Rs2_16317 [Raphanus sativus]
MKFTSIEPYEYNNNDMFLDLVKFDKILSGQLDNNFLIGKLQISNAFDTSQLLIDPPIDESDDLKEMFKCDPANMSIVESNDDDKRIVRQENKVIRIESWDPYEDKTVSELLNSTQIEDPELLPQSLKDVVGKTLKFGVCIEKNNVAYGSESYKVSKVWSINNMLMIDSQSETKSARDEVSFLTDGEQSSVSLRTPTSKRAQDEKDDFP